MKQPIVINYTLSKAIIQKNRLNEMSTYFLLSTLFVGRCIHNFKQRLSEISSLNGTTEKTLKKHVNQLIEDDLAYFNNDILYLRGKKHVAKFFGIKYFYALKYIINEEFNSKGIKLLIRALIIKDSFAQQSFKSGNSKTNIKKSSRRYFNDLNNPNNKPSLSQFGFTKLMNKKSKSTGNYHIKRLSSFGFINSISTDDKFIIKGDRRALNEIRQNDIKGVYYIANNGKIFKRQCNKITFNF